MSSRQNRILSHRNRGVGLKLWLTQGCGILADYQMELQTELYVWYQSIKSCITRLSHPLSLRVDYVSGDPQTRSNQRRGNPLGMDGKMERAQPCEHAG